MKSKSVAQSRWSRLLPLRARQRRRMLSLEALESRFTLDGSVSVYVDDGNLHVDGDGAANRVRVQQVGDDTFTVSSLDGSTRLNGQTGPVTFGGVRNDLRVRLFDGNDVLELLGVEGDPLTIRDELVILTHEGHDQVRMTQVVVFNDVFIDTGIDDDTLDIGQRGAAGGMWVGDRTTIVTGHGQDDVGIAWSTFRDTLVLDTGGNEDDVLLINSTFDAESDIIGGAADDSLTKYNNQGWWRLNVINFERVDANNPPSPTPPPNSLPFAANDFGNTTEGGSTTIDVAANDSDPEGQLVRSSIVITQQPGSGTATLNANGTITYVHNGSETASDSFRYTIRDASGAVSNEATVSISVALQNDPPIAVGDSASVNRGASTTINVAANDSDAEGALNPSSIVVTQQPTSGTVTVSANGTVTYTHNNSATSADSFRYTIRDAQGSVSNEATVNISVSQTAPLPQAPVANPDSASVTRGTSATINVAANDTDPDGSINLNSIVITQLPTSGAVNVNANGTVTYTNNGSAATSDSFRYIIRDNQGNASNETVVSITVTPAQPVNLAPTATNDSATVNRGAQTTIPVSANDIDPEGQLNPASIVITQQPTSGTVTVNANGSVTYAHNNSTTTTDSFRYTIRDAQGSLSNEATVSIAISQPAPLPQSPVANPDSASVTRGTTATINVAANDTDPDGTIDLDSIVITLQPTSGTVTANANGTVSYSNNGSAATSDSFRYIIRDNQGNASNETIVSIAVTPAQPTNQAPTAANDSATVERGAITTIPVSANDSDPEGQLNPASITITQQPASGTVTVGANGTVTYDHNGAAGTTDSFRYIIRDAQGLASNEAVVTISVTDVGNQAPVANPDSATVTRSASATINVAANDTDADGTLDLDSIVITLQPTSGTVTVNANGTVTYTNNGSAATSDSFRYAIRDNEGQLSNEAVVSLTIQAGTTNQPPTANPDSQTLARGETARVNVAANDVDPEGQLDLDTVVITVAPLFGTATANTDGTVTYVHGGGTSEFDSFRYTIRDAAGNLSNETMVVLSIGAPLNQNPTATNDAAVVSSGGSAIINVAGNDAAASGSLDLDSILITQSSASGVVLVNGDGSVTYTHNGAAGTSDSFRYTIRDSSGRLSNEATVTLTITPASLPVARNDLAEVVENSGTSATGNVLTNDTAGSGTLSVNAVGGNPANVDTVVQGRYGTFHIEADGDFTYDLDDTNPEVDALDSLEELIDSLAYIISDDAAQASATLSVRIRGTTDA